MRVSIGREDLVVATYFDLTAQRLATRTLEDRKLELERIVTQRTSELTSVLDAMPDLFFRMKRDGTIVDFRCRPPRGPSSAIRSEVASAAASTQLLPSHEAARGVLVTAAIRARAYSVGAERSSSSNTRCRSRPASSTSRRGWCRSAATR